jgi:hypothetical protein
MLLCREGPGANFWWEAKNVLPHRGAKAIRKSENDDEERGVWPYLLELLDGTLVNSTALVDQVTCM